MYFLDTCICVEFLRGRLKSGYELMQKGRHEDFQLPSIVVAELFFGAEHSSNPVRESAIVEAFVGAFQIAPFDAASAREYGRLRQSLGEKGQLIGDRDIMIASCAIANQAILVSRNIKEFKRVPNLRLETWEEQDLPREMSI